MLKLSDMSFAKKLTLLILISLTCLGLFAAINFEDMKTTIYSERQDRVRLQVETATSIAEHFYNERHRLGEDVAKALAQDTIGATRFDRVNYFWVIDLNSRIVAHPTLVTGADMQGKVDAKGNLMWAEMNRLAKSQGDGFLEYYWASPEGELGEKVSYVKTFEPWQWVIGSGVQIDDINKTVYQNALILVFFSTIAGLILTLAGMYISRNMTRPIADIITHLKAVAAGNLTQSVYVERADEVGTMERELAKATSNLRDTLSLTLDSAQRSKTMAATIATSSETTATSVQSQEIELEQLATAMSQMTATIQEVARSTEQAAINSETITSAITQSDKLMEETIAQINNVATQVNITYGSVKLLRQGVEEIGEITSIIQGISEQTNLLALNAAIEAARAGEHGRGFSVVADEVRGLAQRTQASTKLIKETVASLTQSSQDASQAMDASRTSTQGCIVQAEYTRHELANVTQQVQNANALMAQIASATEEQGCVSEAVTQSVANISRSANDVRSTAVQLAQQSQSLAHLADNLNGQMTQFSV
jgi:methyl-accepting chemotaxis protein